MDGWVRLVARLVASLVSWFAGSWLVGRLVAWLGMIDVVGVVGGVFIICRLGVLVSLVTARLPIPTLSHQLRILDCASCRGYMSNSDLMLHFTSEFARSGALVLCMDLPGHGRSDGMLTYIPDWFVPRASPWRTFVFSLEIRDGKGEDGHTVAAVPDGCT